MEVTIGKVVEITSHEADQIVIRRLEELTYWLDIKSTDPLEQAFIVASKIVTKYIQER